MPNRAERRAAEREAADLARQANFTQAPVEPPITTEAATHPFAAAPNSPAPGLWRHNGSLHLLSSESKFGFEATWPNPSGSPTALRT